MESKYLKDFEVLRQTKLMPKIRGATLIVECLPKQELKSAGGIILGKVDGTHRGSAEDTRRGLAIILACGAGYSSDEPCELKPGQIVLLPYSPLYLSELPGIKGYTANTVALINESDVLVYYESFEQLERIESTLSNCPDDLEGDILDALYEEKMDKKLAKRGL